MSTAPQPALDRRSSNEFLSARAAELLNFIPSSLRPNAEHVIALAISIWQDEDTAFNWLTKPHQLLKDQAPIHRMVTSEGCDKVEDLLHSLEYGLPL